MREDFALQSLRLLREHRESLGEPNDRKVVPKGYLGWVRQQLQVDWWSVLLYSKDGRLTVTSSGGTQGSVEQAFGLTSPVEKRTFVELLSVQAVSNGIHAIELIDRKRHRERLAASYGYLAGC